MTGPGTAAVVVDWRRPEETLAALWSLERMDPAPDHVICVENGCTADEVARVRSGMPPRTVLLELSENLGFTGGVNTGMAEAARHGAEWTLILNNDATVSPGCLGRCLAAATASPRVAVVGPAVAFAEDPGRLWFAGGRVSHRFAYTRHTALNGPAATPPADADVEFVSGCCALISMRAWSDEGPFREDLFAYYEDAEWCVRVRAHGWRCRYLGEVLCHHAVGVSTGQRGSLGLGEATAYYLARNPLRAAIDTPTLSLRATRVAGILSVWLGYNAWRILQSRRPAVAGAYAAGLRDAVRGRMGRRPAPTRSGR